MNITKDATIVCPDNYCQGNNSKLWFLTRNAFKYEIKERYQELRKTIFDNEALKQRFRDFINKIPQEEYDDDYAINPNIFKGAELDFIENWIDERLAYVDSKLLTDIIEIKANDLRVNFNGENNDLSGTYNLAVGEQSILLIQYFQKNANSCNYTAISTDESIITNERGLITAIAPGTAQAKFTVNTKSRNINFKVFEKNTITDPIITDGLLFWFDARDFKDSIPITDRTGVCPLEIVGEPTFENNSLIFDGVDDGIFIRKLDHRILSRKTFTVEIWFNDIYPDMTYGTIASLGTEYRGYGNAGVSYSSATKINVGRTAAYSDGVISYNRVFNQTNRAVITQGPNKISSIFNDELSKQNNVDTIYSDACIGCTANNKFYKSSVCSFRIYNRVLSDEELQINANYEKSINRLATTKTESTN